MNIGIDGRVLGTMRALDRYTKNIIENIAQVSNGKHSLVVFVRNSYRFHASDFKFPKALSVDFIKLKEIPTLFDHFIFCRNVKKYNLDVLFHPDNRSFLFCSIAQVTTIHDLIPQKFPNLVLSRDPLVNFRQKLYFSLQKTALERVSKIIAVSRNTKKDIISEFGADKEKIAVIYEGIENHFKPQKKAVIGQTLERYKITPPYIFYLGGFGRHKNVLNLVKAFEKYLKESEDKETFLVLGGKPGDDNSSGQNTYSEINTVAQSLGIEKRILFPGFLAESDLPAIYSGAKVFVFPSKYEGFGFPPLEAMACGVPVVVSKKASLPEVVGEAALFANSVDEIADSIKGIMVSPALAKELSANGLTQSKKFSWKKAGRETLKVLESAK